MTVVTSTCTVTSKYNVYQDEAYLLSLGRLVLDKCRGSSPKRTTTTKGLAQTERERRTTKKEERSEASARMYHFTQEGVNCALHISLRCSNLKVL